MRTFVFALVLTLASSLVPESVFAQTHFKFVRTGEGWIQQSAGTVTFLSTTSFGTEMYIDGFYAGTIGIPAGTGGAPSSGASLTNGSTLIYSYESDEEPDAETLSGQSSIMVSPDQQAYVDCVSIALFDGLFTMPEVMSAEFHPRLSQTVHEDFILEQAPSSTAIAAEIEVQFDTGAVYGPGLFGAVSYGGDTRLDGIVWRGDSPVVIITGSTVDGFWVSQLNEWGVFEDTYFPGIVTGFGSVGGFSGITFLAAPGDDITYDIFVDTPMWIYDMVGDKPLTSGANLISDWSFSLTATGITAP